MGGATWDDGGVRWGTAAETGYHGTLEHPCVLVPNHKLSGMECGLDTSIYLVFSTVVFVLHAMYEMLMFGYE